MTEEKPPNGNGPGELPPMDKDMVIEFVDHEDPGIVSERHKVPGDSIDMQVTSEPGGVGLDDERVAKLEDQLLRIRADFQNHRKREERERGEARRSIEGQTLLKILPILDNFDRAVQQTPEGEDKTWREGIELIDQVVSVLCTIG